MRCPFCHKPIDRNNGGRAPLTASIAANFVPILSLLFLPASSLSRSGLTGSI